MNRFYLAIKVIYLLDVQENIIYSNTIKIWVKDKNAVTARTHVTIV